jgi:PAS domain S-box-containing protein
MVINADGTTADASPEALALLGLTLDELRALPPGALSPEPADPAAEAAFREQWEGQGSPDIAGEATVRRLDGTSIRVKFGITPIEDGRFMAMLEPVAGPTEQPPTLYTAGQVLAEWRAAERRLITIPPETPEWHHTQAEIDTFRQRYQELFKRR